VTRAEDLEQAVVEFLERREREPGLEPEAFARARGRSTDAELVAALHHALEIEDLFPAPSRLPEAIGPYAVIDEIGRGGMGVVYRVEKDGVRYALKLLPLAPVLGPRTLERFRREADALARLSHPLIVKIHDAGLHDEMPYLVLDLVEGRPLQRMAATLGIAEAALLVERLAETLEAAHRAGILHRDLKPQNVLVRADGAPVLLDFGLSVADESPTLTATGEIVGTPRYMAPEQLGNGRVDARTDVYALALVLYELVTGRPAHGDAKGSALLEAVRGGRVAAPRSVAARVPPALDRVLRTALATRPARRYPSAAAFAADLARFRRGEPVRGRPPGRVATALEHARARPAWAAAVALAVVSAALIAGLAWRAEPTPEQRRRAAAHADRATTLWLAADSLGARREAALALRLDRRDPTAAALNAHLARAARPPGGTRCARVAWEGLRRFEAGDATGAIADFAGCAAELRPGLVSAVVGLSAVRAGDARAALDELTNAARWLPASVRIHRGLAEVCRQLDRPEEARRALERALELDPGSAETWTDIAEIHLRRRDLDQAHAAAVRADSLSEVENARLLRVRGTIEVHSGRAAAGRELLARAVALDPGDVLARYQIAYSLDLDHDIAGAARAYRAVLEVDTSHAASLVCLANLHSGASRGQCKGCDAAFAAHPEQLDWAAAEAFLLRALEADRGAQEWICHSARDVALRLGRRDAVIATLERLTAARDGAPATLRLEEVLRRIRLAEAPDRTRPARRGRSVSGRSS
jgi:tetratricopeptide (TPR) repeat protein/predicted Ser/Thr protein kinase